jgi:phosphate transport system substrate-binding protein
MNPMKRASIVAVCLCAVSVWAQAQIVIGGAGSMIPIAQELAKAFQASNPGSSVEVISASMGSTGGIKALEAGRVNIALVARLLRPEEKAKLVYRPIGRVPVVFAVHKDIAASTLKESQVCDLFSGKIKLWSEVGGGNQKVIALTRNEDDGTKEAVRNSVACFKALRESPDAVVITRSAAMISGLSTQSGTIGITELNNVNDSKGAIKALALDGVNASPETVSNGKYKLVKDYGFATNSEPQGLARRFLDFSGSAEAQKILTGDGIVVSR